MEDTVDMSDVIFNLHVEASGETWIEVSSMTLYLLDLTPQDFTEHSLFDEKTAMWYLDAMMDSDTFTERFVAQYGEEPRAHVIDYEDTATHIRSLQRNANGAKVTMH